jgi:WD40 repeat protein
MHVLPITSVRFAHRRALLVSGGKDGGIVAWDIDRSAEMVGVGLVEGAVEDLAFAPNDRALASIDTEGHITVWTCQA